MMNIEEIKVALKTSNEMTLKSYMIKWFHLHKEESNVGSLFDDLLEREVNICSALEERKDNIVMVTRNDAMNKDEFDNLYNELMDAPTVGNVDEYEIKRYNGNTYAIGEEYGYNMIYAPKKLNE